MPLVRTKAQEASRCDYMKRWLIVFSVLTTLVLLGMSSRFLLARVGAQSASASSSPTTVTNTSQVASPTLDCQGCHAPGKTLPYLAGAKFHAGVHTAYDHGFHAQAIQNGTKAAACLDCHTKNNDLFTVLPASDPKSTINRANIAETCGRCHGDKSIMKGSGISNRPFLSYRESVHAKALAQGNASAAVCTDCHNSHDILPASNPQSPIA